MRMNLVSKLVTVQQSTSLRMPSLADWRVVHLVSVPLRQAFRAICDDGSSLLNFEIDDDDEAQRAVMMAVPWLPTEQFAQSHEAHRCHDCNYHQGREPCDIIAMQTPSVLGVTVPSTIESASEAVVSLDDPCQSAVIRENTNLAMLSVINILSSHVLAAFDQPLSFSSTSSGRIDQEAM